MEVECILFQEMLMLKELEDLKVQCQHGNGKPYVANPKWSQHSTRVLERIHNTQALDAMSSQRQSCSSVFNKIALLIPITCCRLLMSAAVHMFAL